MKSELQSSFFTANTLLNFALLCCICSESFSTSSVQSLSEEEVESVLADDDGFDTGVFSTVLDALQQDKLKGQAAFEEVARNAFEDGLIRIGRKINGQGVKSVVPSTDAEAALLAKSKGGSASELRRRVDAFCGSEVALGCGQIADADALDAFVESREAGCKQLVGRARSRASGRPQEAQQRQEARRSCQSLDLAGDRRSETSGAFRNLHSILTSRVAMILYRLRPSLLLLVEARFSSSSLIKEV